MASLSMWIETVAFSLLFIALFNIVITDMNVDYSKNYSVPFVDNSRAEAALKAYQESSQNKITGGETSFVALLGIQLKFAYDLVTGGAIIAWDFMIGGWIDNALDPSTTFLGLGATTLALWLRILFILSWVSIILFIAFRVIA